MKANKSKNAKNIIAKRTSLNWYIRSFLDFGLSSNSMLLKWI